MNTPTLAANTPNQSYVYATYADFLSQSPSLGVVNGYTTALDNGSLSRSTYVSGLANSTTWVNAIVTGFYHDTLGREPDSGGLNYWSQKIRTGQVSVAKAAASFYSSAEYFTHIGGGTLTTWVRDLYPKLLGRAPDSGGVTYSGVPGPEGTHRGLGAHQGGLQLLPELRISDEAGQRPVPVVAPPEP